MSRRLHLALAALVGLGLTWLGAHIVGLLVPDTYLALGLGLLIGISLGACFVAYWEEVIDRSRR